MYSNFQSVSELNDRKEETRQARKIILEQAKKSYEYAEAKKEKARKEGQGTWMLDSVSQRISKEEKEMEKAKKKKKKRKKEKKDKKKKEKKHSSSSFSSASDDDGAGENVWMETSVKMAHVPNTVIKGAQLQRDSWMELPLDLIPVTSRQQLRDAVQKEKDEAKREAEMKLEPGQHARELNPYWKDGGSGLPEKKPEMSKHKPSSSTSLPSAGAGDGGLSWLHKAYDRCKQQAQDEGRSLEEVAAERWGSLDKLKSMLVEAERNIKGEDRLGSRTDGRSRGWDSSRQNREIFYDGSSSGDESKSRGRVSSRRREDSKERDKDRNRNSNADRSSDRFSEKGDSIKNRQRDDRSHDGFRSSDRSKKTAGFKRPDSDSEGESSLSRSSVRSSKGDFGFEKQPSSSHTRNQSYQGTESRQKHFMKPGEDFAALEARDRRQHENRSSNSSPPRWKKKTAVETRQEERQMKEREDEPASRKSSKNKLSRSSSADSDSSNDTSSDSKDESSDDKQNEVTHVSPAVVLSEEQLNELAAKILRAEIMGDDVAATALKLQLDNARKVREASKSESGTSAPDFFHRRREDKGKKDQGRKRRDEEEDNVVVLSRTSKGGLVRPVLGSSEDRKDTGEKRRKRNVATHDVGGERTIYFDDDDKFDLKTLVEQEKAGTAEDQNSMFARLAGRAGDKDLDVDDMFVSKAARKQNQEQMAAKDRSAAIFEHKKTNAAMEKCHRCFEKVPKHLIIAIGTKSYLCLPHHRSLTEGHCFIVPMQHVSAATSMDEDVWLEMQLFRKSLVQMFAAKDQDMVVMETVMHLKHFPHTAIECVPLDREMGDLAPIYFKKAIQDVGPEWSDNKKLHSLGNKDIRHVIPKGLPYFCVDFGLQGGFATVIEDERTFPSYFGREIVGGMLDAEPALWRKPHKQSFEDQRQKVLQFAQRWQPFDWTQK